jgi:hypothetical protein
MHVDQMQAKKTSADSDRIQRAERTKKKPRVDAATEMAKEFMEDGERQCMADVCRPREIIPREKRHRNGYGIRRRQASD